MKTHPGHSRIEAFRSAMERRRGVKVIAGIANFDLDNILAVVRSAEAAGATAVDVAARTDIVEAVRAATGLTVFASSVEPQALADAAQHGADVVELGNFDALYDQGLFLSHEEVLNLAQETVNLVCGKALVSVTIPGHLSVDTQVKMLAALEEMGVDMIQTEGAARVLATEPQVKALSAEEKAALTFSNTRALAAHSRLPLITASGISVDNVAEAFALGASAIGVGSAVNKLGTEAEMLTTLSAMIDVVNALPTQTMSMAS